MTAKRERPLSKWGRKKLIREVRLWRTIAEKRLSDLLSERSATLVSNQILGIMQGLRECKRAGTLPKRKPKPYDWDEREALCVGESAREVFG